MAYRDIALIKQAGTRKTAAYGLPLMQKTGVKDTSVQALKKGDQVVVSTPGRLKDIIQRNVNRIDRLYR